MRRTMLGLVLGAALAAGCGGGGGGAASFQMDPPAERPTEQTVNYTIPALGAGEQATLLLTSVAGDELDRATNVFMLSPGVRGRAQTAPARQAVEVEAEPVCGSMQGIAQMIDGFRERGSVPSREELRTSGVRSRTVGLPAGSEIELTLPTTSLKGAFVKLLGDEETVHCSIWAQKSTEGPVISAAMARRIARVFDSSNPFDRTEPGAIGIYGRMTGLFGHEWNTNPAGGLDGDMRVNLVFIAEELMPDAAGYVMPGDAFPVGLNPYSNEGEFIYMRADRFDDDGVTDMQLYEGYSTLSHEMLHLIHINRKMIQDGNFPHFDPDQPIADTVLSLTERWSLLEGFAEAGSTMTGFGVARAQVGGVQGGASRTSLGLIDKFLEQPNFNFFDFAFERGGADHKFYGGGHLLGLYIMERFGEDALAEIIKSPNVGFANLTAYTGVTQEDLFHGFHMAVYGDTIGAPAPHRLAMVDLRSFNLYRPSDGGAPGLWPVQPLGVDDAAGADGRTTLVAAPWGMILVPFTGDGGDLDLQVNMPLKAQASLFHEAPKGVFSSVR